MSRFKQLLYNRQAIEFFSNKILESYSSFDQKLFLDLVFDEQWEQVDTKFCMVHLSQKIHQTLNKPYLDSLEILLHANKNLKYNLTNLILPEYVSLYGLDYFDESMQALKEFTRTSSSEFAIRQFIHKDQEKSMQYLYQWATDKDHHVRRLASEGCRPILPWSFRLQQFVKDPTPIIPILQELKQDPELYVQRSVSNNLNDISRHHPDLVIQLCREWSKLDSSSTKFIIKKACRTILKQGNQDALNIFGVGAKEQVRVSNIKIQEKNIRIGQQFTFSFHLEDMQQSKETTVQQQPEEQIMQENQNNNDFNSQINETPNQELQQNLNKEQKSILRIDYKIYYLKKNGKHSPQVYSMRYNYNLKKKIITLSRHHKAVNEMGKTYYPGVHYISIVINGLESEKQEFYLYDQEK